MQAREHWIIYAAPSFSVQHVTPNNKQNYKNTNTSTNENVKRQATSTKMQEEAWQKLCHYQDKHYKTKKRKEDTSTGGQEIEHKNAVKLLSRSKHCLGDQILVKKKKKKRKNDDSSSSSSSDDDENKFAQFAFSSEQIKEEHHHIVQRERQKKQQNDNTLMLLL